MVLAHCASPCLRWGVPCALCPLVLLSITKAPPSSRSSSCSPLHLPCPGLQHSRNLKVLLLSPLEQPSSLLLGCHGEDGSSLRQTNHQPQPQLWMGIPNYTLQGRVAGGWGGNPHKYPHLYLHGMYGRNSVFWRTDQALELKEAIYVLCNFHFEVPQI